MSELSDTQNESDDRCIPIDRVGIKGLRLPVEVREQDGGTQRTVAIAKLTVDLPAHLKGTHMSRFVEALHEQSGILDVRSVENLPRNLLSRLSARRAQVEFRFPYFLKKAAPVSGKAGFMDYDVTFSVDVESDGACDFMLTVVVPVATLCPCSKAISERGAHNQRGLVIYSVRSTEPISIEELISIVEESASCELFSILKRTDEKAVTERAYDNPVFVEDLVRNVAERSNARAAISWYRVEAENFESIHNHSAYAMIEKRG